MKHIPSALILSASLLLAACGGGGSDSNCNDQINDTLKDTGANPEEITKYDSDGYHSHQYWWWNRGFERTFTWGDNIDGCQTSDYRFAPIR
jgi:outer membrane biogenesis lipoprotein LolB